MDKETLLEKYLQDKLNEPEWQEFNDLLKSDPDFRAEAEFQMDVRRAITTEEDENFMNILADFETEARVAEQRTASTEEQTEAHREAPKTKSFPKKWLVAASIALLAGLTYFFTANQTANPHDLFTENFVPYRNVTHPITRGEETNDAKNQAFLAYSKGNYQEALPLFTALYTSAKEPYYLFYKANALIQLNRAEEAIPLLQEHLQTDDSLTDKSTWYLAMAYLQLEDTKKAKEALKKVVEMNTYKAKEAKQLLEEL
ncbi:tetratricopeptide repeat protein [Pareuzebyella sediminis]|uniref:tetratricopeptide repeat protein n=1 Tax=Pareuzebyella sediminis TaxID=2607998 RepID=UPI0011EDC7D5|nr:tetratricopeptide repeat protein [Pareuzebyella sediminis]